MYRLCIVLFDIPFERFSQSHVLTISLQYVSSFIVWLRVLEESLVLIVWK